MVWLIGCSAGDAGRCPQLVVVEDLRAMMKALPTHRATVQNRYSDPPCLLRFRTTGFLAAEGMRYMIRFSFVRSSLLNRPGCEGGLRKQVCPTPPPHPGH